VRVAVITPYHREPLEMLAQCHRSVEGQEHPATHFMVADGHPREEVAGWPVEHVVLPRGHGDNGDTPRGVGSLCAIGEGFEAIAYLDADNWYHPDHIASLVALARETGADVCTSTRTFHRLDGSELPARDLGEGEEWVDTSCLFLTDRAFRVALLWSLVPRPLSPMCDRLVWQGVLRGHYRVAHSGRATVAFRSQYAHHYRENGEPPPPGAKEEVFGPCLKFWHGLSEDERVMYCARMGFPLVLSRT
jgi:hypothetical protein